MRNFFWNSLHLLLLLTFTGCSGADSNKHVATIEESAVIVAARDSGQQSQDVSPEAILLRHLNAKIKSIGKSKDTYNLYSSKDKAVLTEEEYLSNGFSYERNFSPKLKSLINQFISFTVKNRVIDGSSAQIEVETSYPIYPPVIQISLLKSHAYNPKLEEMMIAYLQSPELQLDISVESYRLIEEPEGWRVFYDLATRNKMNSLIEEAEILVPSLDMIGPVDGSVLESMKPKLFAAQKKYLEVLSLGEDFLAKNRLEYLEEKIDKLRFYERLKPFIEIKNIVVGRGSSGGKAVFGEIKNHGDIALNKIGITIYFLDSYGNPVHEIFYHPVYVTNMSYGDKALPLKPNYTRKFGVKAGDAPAEWAEKVKVVVFDLEAE